MVRRKRLDMHVHKYIRLELGKTGEYEVFKCALPGCNHYQEKKLCINAESICWRCGEVLILTANKLTLKKPHCDHCTRPNSRTKNKPPTVKERLKRMPADDLLNKLLE